MLVLKSPKCIRFHIHPRVVNVFVPYYSCIQDLNSMMLG
jgi:hypothetical protein